MGLLLLHLLLLIANRVSAANASKNTAQADDCSYLLLAGSSRDIARWLVATGALM